MTPRQMKRRLRRQARRSELPPDYSYWAQECSGIGCPCCDPGMMAEKGHRRGPYPGEAYQWRREQHHARVEAHRAVQRYGVKLWGAYPVEAAS